MKKLAIVGAFLLLSGCAEVENYNEVVKHPRPPVWKGTGSRKVRSASW